MPSDRDTERPDPAISKAALTNLIGGAAPEQRAILLAAILFAHASGLTLEELVDVAREVKPHGEPDAFMDYVESFRAHLDRKVRDATASIRRGELRPVRGGKYRPG